MGLGFWSKLDPVGQDAAITFQSVREAKRVVRSWETRPTGIQYKQVRADITKKDGSVYASIEACFRAGLPGWDPWLAGILGRNKYITPRRRKRLSDKKDSTIKQKANHVRAAKQDRYHMCHWPGCKELVPPAKWGCKNHWFKLPLHLRNRIWAAYRIGQENTLTPSRKYVTIACETRDWIEENYPHHRKRLKEK